MHISKIICTFARNFLNGNKIVNQYNAAGQKCKTEVYTTATPKSASNSALALCEFETDSVDYVITEHFGSVSQCTTPHGSTQHISNSIGFYCSTDDQFYHYVKDHLGNVRVVVNSETGAEIQSTTYYASGVPMTQRSEWHDNQPYLYNGKEFVEAHGYDTYDYGFRGYYATIGRFTTMDPLCEQTPWQSPYVYAGNNFVNAIDYMGLQMSPMPYPKDDLSPHERWLLEERTKFGSWGGYDNEDKDGGYIFGDEDVVCIASWDLYIQKMTRLYYDVKSLQSAATRNYYRNMLLSGSNLSSVPRSDGASRPAPIHVGGRTYIAPQKMSHDAYMRMLTVKSLTNQPKIRSPYCREAYLENFNSFEQGMMTSPIVQGIAAGGLIWTLGVAAEASVMTTYIDLGNNIGLQKAAGITEGILKGFVSGTEFSPYLYESLPYMVYSDATCIGIYVGKEVYYNHYRSSKATPK